MVTRRALLAAALVGLAAVGACGHSPDTTLDPQPAAVAYAALQHPFAGADLAVDPTTQAAAWERENDAGWLAPISGTPQAHWLNSFQDVENLPTVLAAARRERALPVVVAYLVPNRGCSSFKEGAPYGDYERPVPRPDSYAAWISDLIRVLGPTRAVVVVEPDAVAADCFDDERARTLHGAVDALVAARQYVYVDAGHPNWVQSGAMAERLMRSGVADAEGVALNVSNRYPTEQVARFGEELSDLIGGRDYVVDTSRNGFAGPGATTSIADDWCNRPSQALGPRSAGDPRYPHLAAQVWIKPPGESDGNSAVFPNQDCHGETEPPGVFSATQAAQLIANDPRQPASARSRARDHQPPEPR